MMRFRSLAFSGLALLAAACADSSLPTSPDDDVIAPQLSAVQAGDISGVELTSPVFALATNPDGSLVAAETAVGVTELRMGAADLVASLPGVSGVAPVGRGNLFAVTGAAQDPSSEPDEKKLFRVSRGSSRLIADLGAFEETVNPDQVWNTGAPDSNPFNVAHLNGASVLVADAAGNDILHVDGRGNVDWVAVLTPHLVPTANFKSLLGCGGPASPPECALPDEIPAQPVATSVAVGPDGAYYAGELTGFPGEPGFSRIWRIEPGSMNVLCPSAACTMVADGLTSIVDLAFGPDGTLYVVELDAASWLAVELAAGPGGLTPVAGGRIKACDVATGTCGTILDGLSLPSAITVGTDGVPYFVQNTAIPFGTATISSIN